MTNFRFETVAAVTVLTVMITLPNAVHSTELSILSPAALRSAMLEIVPKFESSSGHKIKIDFGAAGAIAGRVQAGEQADVVIVTAEQIDDLQKHGRIAEKSKVNLAQVGIGAFIKKGSTKPSIDSEEAFKRVLLAAQSIGHNDPASGAPSGIFAAQLLAGLDIAPQIKGKIKLFPANTGGIYEVIAKGEVDIGLGQITEIRAQSSVDLVGPLPDTIQNYTLFAAGIATGAQAPSEGVSFIRFLASPMAVEIMKEKGLVIP